MSDIKFENALKKLEDIVRDLESGDIALDEALKKYEEGVNLAAICQKKIDTARKKVEILVKSKDGKIRLEPFEAKKTSKQKQEKEEEELF